MQTFFRNSRISALALSVCLLGGLFAAPVATEAQTHKPAIKKPANPAVKPNNAAVKSTSKTVDVKTADALPAEAYIQASPVELLKAPEQYLNKPVEMVGVFNRFSDTGLDYKKAFRDSRDYVSLFILRPNVEPKTIPLSELKLFFPRKKSEEVMNLESGDTIRIRGKVFSTALNEPWVDILEVKILQKTKDSTKKPNEDLQ